MSRNVIIGTWEKRPPPVRDDKPRHSKVAPVSIADARKKPPAIGERGILSFPAESGDFCALMMHGM